MYGDQFGEFVCGYGGSKEKMCISASTILDWTTEDIKLVIFYDASYLINNKVGRQKTSISV